MQYLSENAILISGKSSALVVQLTDRRDENFGTSAYSGSIGEHVSWGAGDNQPNLMSALINKNNQVRPLLDAQRDMIYGSGGGFFKRTIVDGKIQLTPYTDSRLEDWAFQTDLDNYEIGAINERVQNANVFTRIEYLPDGTPMLSVSDCFLTRIGRPKAGNKVTEFCLNPSFGNGSAIKSELERVPAFDRLNPTQHIVSIWHGREYISGNPFYAFPSWWCAKDWIELANLIAPFHINGLKNGYNIKYVIKVPKDYFDKEGGKSLDEKAVGKKWSDWTQKMSDWLSGVENVNKALIVRYLRGDDGKALDAIDVVPLKNEMSDDAYSKVWEMANIGITNAVGILPVLGGVTPGSKSGDSGSQIRVVANYQQSFRTPVHRKIILDPVNFALRAMGYTDVVRLFMDVQLTTLDAAPTGTTPAINPNAA